MEACFIQLLEHSWDVNPKAVDAMGHWSLATGMGALYERDGVCFGVAEQEIDPRGGVRWMGSFRARLLASQTKGDAHKENATPA